MAIGALLTLLGASVVRSVAGWAENALEDGTVSKFEWKQLGATFLRIGIVGASLYFGLGADAVMASAGAVVLDIGFNALKGK